MDVRIKNSRQQITSPKQNKWRTLHVPYKLGRMTNFLRGLWGPFLERPETFRVR